MIKKAYLVFIPVIVLTVAISGVYGAKEQVDEKKMKELVQRAKDKLNNTTWDIELMQMEEAASGGAKKKIEKDMLYFENNMIKSDKLTAEGFPSTNYTIRIKGEKDDVIVWETMQTSEAKGIAFWRGELLESGVMRGVLSWHVNEKDKRDYTFVNVAKEEPAVITPAVQEQAAPVVQEEEPQEAAVDISTMPAEVKKEEPKEEPKTEEKTKKKGWFNR